MARERYSQKQVAEAIRATRGLTTLAARRLGCDRSTVDNYCARYPAVRAAQDEARSQQLDITEAKLFAAIDAGELPAILFYLRTVGRRRGYGDRLEVDATVDVLVSQEWLTARAVLLDALAAYPDAAVAVAGALARLEAP